MKQNSNFVLHPFLFALYPIVALLAFNSSQTEPTEAIRATLIILAGTILLFGLLRLWLKDWQKAGLLLSIYIIIIFGYGHMETFSINLSTIPSLYTRKILLMLIAILGIVGSWGLWRFVKRDLSPVTRFLNIMIVVALILPLINISTSLVHGWQINNQSNKNTDATIQTNAYRPDIYYIILDEYARDDVMLEIFGYDNSGFTDWLTDQGFYVADNAHSNYPATAFSLASSLNFKYLDDVAEQVGIESSDRNPLTPLIEYSQVREFLENQGYTTIAYSTGFNQTEVKSFDIYLEPEGTVINEFEDKLIEKTILGIIMGSRFSEIKRQHVFNILDTLPNIPEITDDPKFVFVHIYAPHDPPSFDANGEPLNLEDIDIEDLLTHGYLSKTFLEAYIGEVIYVNKKIQQAITNILKTSDEPPIIVLQSDHGSRVYLDGLAENICVHERMSILNALYLPDDGVSQLYDSMTPVNTFRIIFNTYFNAEFDLLPDRSYLGDRARPYDFFDVTDRYDILCSG